MTSQTTKDTALGTAIFQIVNVRCVIHVNLCVMSHTSLLVDLCASFEINDSQHSFWEVLSVSLVLILS